MKKMFSKWQPGWPETPPYMPPEEVFRRIRGKTLVDGNGCWIYQGTTNDRSYPVFSVFFGSNPNQGLRKKKGLPRQAHLLISRWIISLKIGRWPAGSEWACHKCDTPRCICPNHIYVGTSRSNMKDMFARNRYQGANNDEKNSLAAQDVQKATDLFFGKLGEGRKAYLEKVGWSLTKLALRYSVSRELMRAIVLSRRHSSYLMTRKQIQEAKRLFYSPNGVGSCCSPGTVLAKWTAVKICKLFGLRYNLFFAVLRGARFKQIKRPAHMTRVLYVDDIAAGERTVICPKCAHKFNALNAHVPKDPHE